MSDEWGEVIMGNSPFAEYLKELQNNNPSLEMELEPILAQQILPPPSPPPPPPPSPPSSLPPTQLSPHSSFTNESILQKLFAHMYNKMYNYVVGSELLHPEESIFLCDEGEEQGIKLKPEIDLLDDFDQLNNWMSSKNQATSKIKQRNKKYVAIIIVGFLSIFFSLHHPLLGLFITFLSSLVFLLAFITGYHFFVQYIVTHQAQIELKIKESIENSRRHDSSLLKVMKSIQEVELIARGYRLSTPLSPIERLEQNAKSRKSQHMRAKTENSISQSRRMLRENSIKFLDFLPQEISATFRAKIADNYLEESKDLTLAELKRGFYQFFLERSRFYSLVLFAFYHATRSNSYSIWIQYKTMIEWQNEARRAVSSWLVHLHTDIVELKTCISTEFWANQIPQRVLLNKTQRTVHERFFQQSKDIKLLLQGIIARVALCEENIHKTNSSESVEKKEKEIDTEKSNESESKTALSELVEQYQIVRRDLAQSLELWDSGNILLLRLIDSLSQDPNDEKLVELRRLVKDGPIEEETDEPMSPVALELIQYDENENQEEQLFEAYTGPSLSDSESEEEVKPPPPPPVSFVPGVPPPPPPMGLKFVSKKKPKKSRAERLAEKEEKGANAFTSVIVPEFEAKRVISELKDVLKIRKPPKQT